MAETRFWPVHDGQGVPETALLGDEPLVIAVVTAMTSDRQEARRQVRAALTGVLARHLGCEEATLVLAIEPGKAPRLSGAEHLQFGISISHAPGVSVVAIREGGPVGVDILHVERELGALGDAIPLARDYLGPGVAAVLAGCPAQELAQEFAVQWSAWEAGLKCLGLPLQETSAGLRSRLDGLRIHPLVLPQGYVGHLRY